MSTSRIPAVAVQGFRGCLSERFFVGRSKPSQLVEAVVGRDAGDSGRRLTIQFGQSPPDYLESLGEQPSLGAHAAHVIERISQRALAHAGDATEF